MAPQEVSQQDVTIHQDYFYQMTEFLTDWHVRVTWVAFTVLWLLWAISWTLRHMFGGDAAATNYVDNTNATSTTATAAAANAPAAGTTDPETGAAAPGATTTTTNPNNPGGKLGFLGSPPAWGQNVYNRMNRSHDILRDLVLMLLSVLVINTFARGSTRGVMIVAWIFLAFAIVWMFSESVFTHRYIRFLYSLIFFALALIIIGLAWKQGFY
ncbi:hypothetical protein VTP01DRAFT_8015 [Rhizomucor pusillus]|uniref:uncharacterized protein n=1 Tax=Rhizomucor pusillus TaxID=4840 RepID=UPI0037428D53